MLTLVPRNVPNIITSLANDMIRPCSTMFAIQLQTQARGSICSTRRQVRTHKTKRSSQSCSPLSTLRLPEVCYLSLSNSNSTKQDGLRILPMTVCELINCHPWMTMNCQCQQLEGEILYKTIRPTRYF